MDVSCLFTEQSAESRSPWTSSNFSTSWNLFTPAGFLTRCILPVPPAGAPLQDEVDERQEGKEAMESDRGNPDPCAVGGKGLSFRRESAYPHVDDLPRQRRYEGDTADDAGLLPNCSRPIRFTNSPSRGSENREMDRWLTAHLFARHCKGKIELAYCQANVALRLIPWRVSLKGGAVPSLYLSSILLVLEILSPDA